MIYKNKGNNLQTFLHRKPIDKQHYLHVKSEHPTALKNSITYSQTLRLETRCFTENQYQRNCAVLERKYNEDNMNKEWTRLTKWNKNNFL